MESAGHSNTQIADAEAFIPYILDDLVDMCLSDDGLPIEQHQSFREFSSVFSSLNNFLSHQAMDSLDRDYAQFNPDSELKVKPLTRHDRKEAEERVVSMFREMAINANYRELSVEEIEASFVEESLIKLRTDVDLDEFTQVECFVRGNDIRIHQRKNWKFQEVDEPVEVWRRVLLLMQFKPDEELTEEQRKKRKKANLPSIPGKVYLYLYKDVPKADLEILFPNVRVSMTRKDQILLGIPAIAATIGTIAKIGARAVLVTAAVVWVFFGKEILNFDPEEAKDPMKLAIIFFGILSALGGLFFKQYNSVKNKRIGFLKEVSEHLFFRNIAMNKAVFDRVIDDGEDEDCKEAVLVYYHLLSNPGTRMNREQLDETIQNWMRDRFNTVIDFDIDGPIEKLQTIGGKTNGGANRKLIEEDPETGELTALSLNEAKEVMDYHWDNAFQFSTSG